MRSIRVFCVTLPSDDLSRIPSISADQHDGTEVVEAEIVEGNEPELDSGVIVVEPERRRSRLPGLIAVLLAVATAVVSGVAVGVATGGDASAGTVLGFTAIGLSVAAVVLGLVAAIARLGRAWGVGAIIVGALANPWLQLVVLRFVAGE